ncbi:MAG: FAD-dependent oxidoreductase [Mesorhizobium sp.]|nr:MAG: FAD-dependent oxidoreductase [Mesorhizobium sp.]TIP49184.1 MAG: FAD-dependent oxidoreductase [Mesorhizobium sp.]
MPCRDRRAEEPASVLRACAQRHDHPPPIPSWRTAVSAPDLLIIGGGATGLSASIVARELGLSVELLDERPALGGNYFAGAGNPSAGQTKLGEGYARGADLLRKANGPAMRNGAFAWRIEPDGKTYFIDPAGKVGSISPRRLLIATGAQERPVPIPGALLPGVMYAGAAQLMLKTFGSVPAGRAVLVGSGPLLLLLAKQLLGQGAAPAAMIETTPRAGLLTTARSLPSALKVPALLSEGFRFRSALKKSAMAWHRQASGVFISGRDKAQSVTFTDWHGRRHTIMADLILLHDGVIPNDHVARQLKCKETWNPGQHCFNTTVDQWGETSRNGIFAAGDCTGIWGVEAARMSGEIAALEIARQLGFIKADERDRRAAGPLRRRARQVAFRPFVETHFPPTLARAGFAADDTVICRCEMVTAGEIRLAVRQGASGPDQLKSFTRCGMGPCQGRSCAMAVAEIIASETGRSIGEIGRHDIRAPLKPLPLGQIAAARDAAEEIV